MESIIQHAPTAGLLFFFFVFLGIAISVLRPGAKKKIEQLGMIPLKEDNNG